LSFNRQIFVGVACQLLLMAGAAMAQTTGATKPAPAAAATEAGPDQPPPGGCMPIGITAAGDVVFPFACKDLIDLHRGKGQQSSATPEAGQGAPAHDAATAAAGDAVKTTGSVAVQPQSRPSTEGDGIKAAEGTPAPAQPAVREKDAPEANRAEPSGSRASRGDPAGCTSFRTYDAKTESYRDFSGRRRPCRS
jgi:hypothetical protein